AGEPQSNIRLVSPREALLFRSLALASCAIYRGYLEDQNTYAWREGLWFLREIARAAEVRIPEQVGHLFRNEVGRWFRFEVGRSDLKSATPGVVALDRWT
ncbi:MAG: hypothetical protein ACOVOB_05580, partial [Brevundimonas sp.]